MFGIQIANEGKITHFGAANDFFHEVMAIDCSFEGGEKLEWKMLEDRYKDIYDRLDNEFRSGVKKTLEGQLLSQLQREGDSTNSPLLTFLSEREGERGLKELRLYSSIAVSHNPRHHPDLFLLRCDSEDSPKEPKLVRACKGVVVQRMESLRDNTHNAWRVCCPAYEAFADGDDPKARGEWLRESQGVDPTRASDVVVFEQLAGWPVCLYCVAGRWMVSSLSSIDASESLRV